LSNENKFLFVVKSKLIYCFNTSAQRTQTRSRSNCIQRSEAYSKNETEQNNRTRVSLQPDPVNNHSLDGAQVLHESEGQFF